MLSEVKKKSWIQIQIRITTDIELIRDIPDSHVPVNFRNDPIEIATARESTDRQTHKRNRPTYLALSPSNN